MSNVINKVHVLLMSIAWVTNLNVNIPSMSYKKYSNHINHEMVIELLVILHSISNKNYMILVE